MEGEAEAGEPEFEQVEGFITASASSSFQKSVCFSRGGAPFPSTSC
jgi:hypothetical protein